MFSNLSTLFPVILTAQMILNTSSHGIENGALFMVLPSDGRNVNNLNWYHGPIQWEKRSITNGDLQVLRQLQTNANTRQANGEYVNSARVMRSAASKQSPDWNDLGWAWG
ncbi:Neuropeptide-like protein 42 [Meloidogyne graminicola]|uniref:Neuropeptide-like protein 42 n=1 Tax=Meloidogyne graminicola TaxID=189291 RepID=A0A8S9ZMF0_9BILA|nr:Neuropeptide-like protein 42 [Meloidogyne graminicola]